MSEFDNACAVYIGQTAYVWGGQGEDVCKQRVDGTLDPEGWIRNKETSETNANRAIKTFRHLLAEGCNPVYAADCSGYVCKVLEALGLIKPKADYNSKGLYALCDSHPTRAELRKGDIVFHSKTGKTSGIHHVGFYMGDDIVSESRGRDYGVVETAFDDKPADWAEPWNLYGRIEGMAAFTVDEPKPEPYIFKLTSPRQKGEAVKELQRFLNFIHFRDANGEKLVEDGIFGPKTEYALISFAVIYAPQVELTPVPGHTLTLDTEPFCVTIDGIVVFSMPAEGGEDA